MLRGKEIKKHFWWARCHVFEDMEALSQKPPVDCQRVFYVSSGNALCSHRVRFADPALANMRTKAFRDKIGGVILLGSVDLWERLYAPTRASGTLVNPTFFDEVQELCMELDVPLLQLDDDVIDNLDYTSDVHPQPGSTRTKLAEHIQKNLVELSQNAADEVGGPEQGWMKQFEDRGKKKTTVTKWKESSWQADESSSTSAPAQEGCGKKGCKWCKKGECWDAGAGSAPNAQMMNMMAYDNIMNSFWGAW